MIVQVSLYGETLGAVDWNEQKGSAIFQYSESSYTNAFGLTQNSVHEDKLNY